MRTRTTTMTTITDSRFDAVEAAMRRCVDGGLLAGASWAILRGRDVVDERCIGLADIEAGRTHGADAAIAQLQQRRAATPAGKTAKKRG